MLYAIISQGNLEMVLEDITIKEYLQIKDDNNVRLFMDEDGICGDDIEKSTISNKFYRRAIRTGENSQVVLMSLKPGEEIGIEVHPNTDQYFRFEKGEGLAIIGSKECTVKDGDYLLVIQGTRHNVINTSKTESLKLYAIYSPPHYPKGIVHPVKED